MPIFSHQQKKRLRVRKQPREWVAKVSLARIMEAFGVRDLLIDHQILPCMLRCLLLQVVRLGSFIALGLACACASQPSVSARDSSEAQPIVSDRRKDTNAPKSNQDNFFQPKDLESMDTADDVLFLAWDQVIDAELFGIPSTNNVHGKTLEEIISSQVAGRDDGQLCSACHNQTQSVGDYGLASEPGASLPDLDPDQLVGVVAERPWSGDAGWGQRFIQNNTKPETLKAVIRAWLASGDK